jgi:hypothetical protein
MGEAGKDGLGITVDSRLGSQAASYQVRGRDGVREFFGRRVAVLRGRGSEELAQIRGWHLVLSAGGRRVRVGGASASPDVAGEIVGPMAFSGLR